MEGYMLGGLVIKIAVTRKKKNCFMIFLNCDIKNSKVETNLIVFFFFIFKFIMKQKDKIVFQDGKGIKRRIALKDTYTITRVFGSNFKIP